MQTRFILKIAAGLALLITLGSCQQRVVLSQPRTSSAASAKGLPPGQAKKLYGHQSAKAFAPGQQKKQVSPVVIAKGKEKKSNKNSDKKKK